VEGISPRYLVGLSLKLTVEIRREAGRNKNDLRLVNLSEYSVQNLCPGTYNSFFEFPGSNQLVEIINAHFPALTPALVEAAVERFTELREKMVKGKSGKKVSTSELLDWVAVLQQFPQDEVLKQLEGDLLFPEVLLKKWEDHLRYFK